jgi:hypothetical protein
MPTTEVADIGGEEQSCGGKYKHGRWALLMAMLDLSERGIPQGSTVNGPVGS